VFFEILARIAITKPPRYLAKFRWERLEIIENFGEETFRKKVTCNNADMDLKEIACKATNWVELPQDRVR
jgi:hypothetical protein